MAWVKLLGQFGEVQAINLNAVKMLVRIGKGLEGTRIIWMDEEEDPIEVPYDISDIMAGTKFADLTEDTDEEEE